MTLANWKTLAAIAIVAPTASHAQEIRNGNYSGATQASTTVVVNINNKRGDITILANGCLGFVEGNLARNDKGQLFLVDDLYDESQCAVAFIPQSATSFRTREGPECSYHHGAGCDFNALVQLQQ